MRAIPLLAILCLMSTVPVSHAAGELKLWSGGPTPALDLTDLDGKAARLEDFRGRVVLVNFWATWCGPCRDEMPSIDRLRKLLAGRPFSVLAVNVDEPDSRVRGFLEKLPLDFPVLMDPGGQVTKRWQVRILPASFLVGPDGRIRYTITGELDWANQHVVALVSELFPDPQPRASPLPARSALVPADR